MILVNLYNFNKSVNSTKQPSGAGTQYQCQLKEDCSIINPVLIFSNAQGNPFTNNYAYISNFSRYYTISDWTWIKGLWQATLSVDTLATYKAQIGASSQYILRCADESNGDIVDQMYPTIAQTSLSSNTDGSPWLLGDSGDYVVGVLGGAGEFYSMSRPTLEDFFSYLYSDVYLNQIIDGIDIDITNYPQLRVQLNPLQYIGSIVYIPRTVSGSGGSIQVGWGSYPGGSSGKISDYTQDVSGSFSIPKHPQSNRGNYLNLAPYSQHEVFFPPYGTIKLDSSALIDQSSVNYDITIDVRTGDSTLRLSIPRRTLTRISGRVGVDVKQTQLVAAGYSAMQGAFDMMGSLGNLAGNPIGSLISAGQQVYTEFGEAAAGQIPTTTTIGGTGSCADIEGVPVLQSMFKLVAAGDPVHKGYPLCETRTISSLSGYILPSNPDVDTPGTARENAELLNILAGGFYYE